MNYLDYRQFNKFQRYILFKAANCKNLAETVISMSYTSDLNKIYQYESKIEEALKC